MVRTLSKIQTLIISILDWTHKPFKGFIPTETFRYAATGGGNTVLDIFLYFVFYNFVFLKENVDLEIVVLSPHIAALFFVFPITFLTGFLLSKYITFTESPFRGQKQLIRYGISVGGAIILNYLLLKLFVDGFGIYATLSKVLATPIVIAYSYIMQKYFTFKTASFK